MSETTTRPAPSGPITVTAEGQPSPDRIAAVWRLLERLARERLAEQEAGSR